MTDQLPCKPPLRLSPGLAPFANAPARHYLQGAMTNTFDKLAFETVHLSQRSYK